MPSIPDASTADVLHDHVSCPSDSQASRLSGRNASLFWRCRAATLANPLIGCRVSRRGLLRIRVPHVPDPPHAPRPPQPVALYTARPVRRGTSTCIQSMLGATSCTAESRPLRWTSVTTHSVITLPLPKAAAVVPLGRRPPPRAPPAAQPRRQPPVAHCPRVAGWRPCARWRPFTEALLRAVVAAAAQTPAGACASTRMLPLCRSSRSLTGSPTFGGMCSSPSMRYLQPV